MSSATTSPAFFEAKYRQEADPWNFTSSPYELERYSRTVASLKSRTFEHAFEAGCSIGVLTEQLAPFCRQLLALDISATAVSQARQRCRQLANVDIRVGSLLTDAPPGPFDLIVLSEIGYYFTPEELTEIGILLSVRLRTGGLLLAAHWLGHSSDHRLSGDKVHEILDTLPGLRMTLSERHPGYRLDHWIKA